MRTTREWDTHECQLQGAQTVNPRLNLPVSPQSRYQTNESYGTKHTSQDSVHVYKWYESTNTPSSVSIPAAGPEGYRGGLKPAVTDGRGAL